MDKPRICEVIGVEVGEIFSVSGEPGEFNVTDLGRVERIDGTHVIEMNGHVLRLIINHPELIIREPQFTEDEKAVLRLLKRGGFVKLLLNDDVCICAKKILNEKFYFPKEILPSFKTDYEIDLSKMNLE